MPTSLLLKVFNLKQDEIIPPRKIQCIELCKLILNKMTHQTPRTKTFRLGLGIVLMCEHQLI